MKVCTIEDCQSDVHCRGWCCKHYNRWLRYGDAGYVRPAKVPAPLPPRPSVMERIEARIRHDANGCWSWTGTRTPAGYGQMSVNAKRQLVHRLAYETFVREIPAGMHLDHLCRNRACVNPKHLDVVTNRENVMRGMSPSAVIRRQGVCKNGHKMVGENIYVPPRNPEHQQCRTCRKKRSREAYARKVAA